MENIIIYFKQGSFMGNVELLIGFFVGQDFDIWSVSIEVVIAAVYFFVCECHIRNCM